MGQFIPPADRPAYQDVDFIETVKETVWFNPFEYDVAVQLHVGSQAKASDAEWAALPPAIRRERQKGIRTYVIPAKATRVISSEFDQAIQQTKCNDPDCVGSKGLYCKDPEHNDRTIVGGQYPRLVNKGTQQRPLTKPPTLHWALDDQRARAEAALEESKRKLAEAQNARDAFLIAQADLENAKQEIARLDANMSAQGKTAEAAAHQDAIVAAGGSQPAPHHADLPKQATPAQAPAKKDR